MLHTLFLLVAVVLAVPLVLYLFWFVHCTLDRICVSHARRFCRQRGLEISRFRWQPAFQSSSGRRVKTESTLVQLDCLDAQKQRRLILLLVWPFSVRKLISDEKYPESCDEQWPLISN